MERKFIITLIVITLCSALAVENRHGADTDDNDFAEFEEFDSDDEFEDSPSNKKNVPGPDQGSKPATPNPEVVIDDDDDDGQVEVIYSV